MFFSILDWFFVGFLEGEFQYLGRGGGGCVYVEFWGRFCVVWCLCRLVWCVLFVLWFWKWWFEFFVFLVGFLCLDFVVMVVVVVVWWGWFVWVLVDMDGVLVDFEVGFLWGFCCCFFGELYVLLDECCGFFVSEQYCVLWFDLEVGWGGVQCGVVLGVGSLGGGSFFFGEDCFCFIFGDIIFCLKLIKFFFQNFQDKKVWESVFF